MSWPNVESSKDRIAGPIAGLVAGCLLAALAACGSDSAGQDAPPDETADAADVSGQSDSAAPDGSGDVGDWRTTCEYPLNDAVISLGKIVPPLQWQRAFSAPGNVDFDLRAFRCAPEFEAYNAAVFSISAGWCPSCPSQIEHLASIADDLEAAGGLLVFVETQTADGLPATHRDSHEYVNHIIGAGGPGIRVGDGETLPNAMAINGSTMITSYPAGFVVRRSDMVVIASQSQSGAMLPYVDIVTNPDSVYETTNPNDDPNCGPADEETYEPNDTAAEAAVLSGDAHFTGGICDSLPDYYRVDIEGSWTMQIEFDNRVGDLDMFVWDEANNRILRDGAGRPVGSNTVNDQEIYQGRGPTTIVIFGYAGATSTYELWLAEIG